MDTIPLSRNQGMTEEAEQLIHQLCPEITEITYIDHGYDNLVVLVNRAYTFRFPRNEAATKRLAYETALLQLLAGKIQAVAIPRVVQAHAIPLYSVSQFIEGDHLSVEQLQNLHNDEQVAIGRTIADFIVELNRSVTAEEVVRLRGEAGVRIKGTDEPWAAYFERLFGPGSTLPNPQLQSYVDEYYAAWKDYVRHQDNSHIIHDDLHPANMLFLGPVLSGILDFGDTNTGSIESEMRGLYHMGEPILRAAVDRYNNLTGRNIEVEPIRVWAVISTLASFTDRLAREDTKHPSFLRAEQRLRAWLPGFPL